MAMPSDNSVLFMARSPIVGRNRRCEAAAEIRTAGRRPSAGRMAQTRPGIHGHAGLCQHPVEAPLAGPHRGTRKPHRHGPSAQTETPVTGPRMVVVSPLELRVYHSEER